MDKNSYRIMFDEYIENYNKVRSAFNLPKMIEGYKVIPYDKYLSDNVEIKNHIIETMKGQGGIDLLIGYTGAGKSYTFIEAANEIRGKRRKDGRTPIIVKCNPGTRQCLQESLSYNNVVCYNESKQYNKSDIYENKILSIVYDKMGTFLRFLEENELLKEYYVVLIIDECHSSISDTYRKTALDRVKNFMDYVVKDNGVVIYTTATFTTTYVLNVKSITFCEPKEFGNIGVIEEINCPETIKSEEFNLNNLINLIEQGYKPCLRLNNIELMDELKENLERQLGYKVAVVNSTNQKTNEVAKAIVDESVLLGGYNCYIFTCILDSATNIKGIKMEDGTIVQDSKICPCFYINKLNTNMDSISQFVARFRFKCEKAQIFVAHHGQPQEEFKTLPKVVNEYGKLYMDELESFELSLKAAKLRYKEDTKAIEKELKYILNECNSDGIRNDRGGIFNYNNGEILFDLYECFNRIYNIYLNQFLYHDDKRVEELEKRFGCKVKTIEYSVANTPCGFVDYTPMKFDKFVEDIKNRADVQHEIKRVGFNEYIKTLEKDEKFGVYMKQIERDDRYKYLSTLTQYEPLDVVVNEIYTLERDVLDKRVENFQRYDFITLTKEQVNQINDYYNNEKPIQDEKAKKVVKNFDKMIIESNRLNVPLQDFIRVLKSRTIEEMEYWLKEENVIQNNQKFNKGIGLGGASGREHFHFYTIIERLKAGKEEVKFNDKMIKEIAAYMGKKCKNSWGKVKVTRYLKLMYNYKEQENGSIIVKGLRLKHR